MSNPPGFEPVDDGLLMRKSGEWTDDKLYFVNKYLGYFIVSMRKKKWRSIHYIDLFAGPGKNKLPDGRVILGSPLLALSQKQPFDHYYFVDNAQANIDALNRRCSQFPEKDKISIYSGDANQVVEQIVMEIEKIDGVYKPDVWPSLNLAFIDPDGLELHWDTVAKLASRRTDMIIYYPQMGITRDAPQQIQSQPPTSIDKFFGDNAWRDVFHRHQRGDEAFLHRALLDHYKQKLAAFEYKIKDPLSEPLFRNTKDTPLYRLLFVSKHLLGNKFWTDVTERLPGGQLRLI